MVAWAWGREPGLTGSGYEGSIWCDRNVPKLYCGDGSVFFKFTKSHLIVHLKQVNCMVCKLYLKKAVKIYKGSRKNSKVA